MAQVPGGAVRLQTTSGTTTAAQCTYGSMSVAPNGAITVTCSGDIFPTSSTTTTTDSTPITTNGLTVGFSLSSSGGTLSTGQTAQLSVTRRGSEGAYNVAYVVTGDACATPGSYSVDFAYGDLTAKPITQVVFNSTGSTCTAALESGLREGTTVATYTRAGTTTTSSPTPTQPAGCPAIPSNAQNETFDVKMSHNRWKGDPTGGKVIIAKMPAWPDSTVPSMISMNSPYVSTPPIGTVRYSITKCPGEIKTDYTDVCNQATDVTMWTTYWLPRAVGLYSSKSAANAAGYCWAPEAEGQWYLNIRYEFNGVCGAYDTTCGMMWQYY